MIEVATRPQLNHETTNTALIGRTLAARHAIRTVDKALEVVGGGAFFLSLGLERLFRDVQGAPVITRCKRSPSCATRGASSSGSTPTASPTRFLADLGRSARRPAVLRRCLVIALSVGTLLSLVNQGDAFWTGRLDGAALSRVLANYLIPFVVANLGAMSSPPPRDP